MTRKIPTGPSKKPDWIKARIGGGPRFARVKEIVGGGKLHTVCEEALCPNRGTCWEHGRATLMILGEHCTRSCRFCGVGVGGSGVIDEDEPRRVAEAVKAMQLNDVVITSVTRDDLADGGARIWAEVIRQVRHAVPGIIIEVLVPDFGGSDEALDLVADVKPDVFGHNLETVPSLYPDVRPGADYDRSLALLEKVKKRGMIAKTGVMVGLGETTEAIESVMEDVARIGVDILTIGQYLQPSKEHLSVERYVEPCEFDAFGERGVAMGIGVVISGPLVRSSYHSDEQDRYVRERLDL